MMMVLLLFLEMLQLLMLEVEILMVKEVQILQISIFFKLMLSHLTLPTQQRENLGD
jgi:hypothetical protein